MAIALRLSRMIPLTQFVAAAIAVVIEGALELLTDEIDGFAMDATTFDEHTAAAYVGGPVGGTVAVISTGDPTDNLSNVAVNFSNLTNAGTSAKTVHHLASPYVRWSAHNYLPSSQDFGSTDWNLSEATVSGNSATGPNGASTADALVESSNNAEHLVTSDAFVVQPIAGLRHTISVYAKANGRNFIRLGFANDTLGVATIAHRTAYFDLANGDIETDVLSGGAGVAAIENAGNGWWRCSLSITPITTGTASALGVALATDGSTTVYTGNGSSGVYLWGAQHNRGPIATPHLITTSAGRIGIPQTYDPAEVKYGIWSEPANTNLQFYSEALDNGAWTKTQSTVSANVTTAPDGSSFADKLVEDGTTNDHSLQGNTQSSTFVGSGVKVTLSVYVKPAGRDYFRLAFSGDTLGGLSIGQRSAMFKVSDGTIFTAPTSPTTAAILNIGNGWYRCSITMTTTGGSNGAGALQLLLSTNGTTTNYAGDSSSGMYAWGAQLEISPVASSMITTVGTSVTRAADVISALDTTFPGSDSNNTVYLDYKPLVVDSGTRYGWAYWKDVNNFYSLAGVTANPTMGNTNAGSPEFAVDIGTLVVSTRTQITIAAKANDFDGSQDGTAPTAQGTATLTTAYTTFYLGTFGTTGSELNGYIYRMVIVPYQRETVNSDLETWRYNF